MAVCDHERTGVALDLVGRAQREPHDMEGSNEISSRPTPASLNDTR
jgi:hypothetical protein